MDNLLNSFKYTNWISKKCSGYSISYTVNLDIDVHNCIGKSQVHILHFQFFFWIYTRRIHKTRFNSVYIHNVNDNFSEKSQWKHMSRRSSDQNQLIKLRLLHWSGQVLFKARGHIPLLNLTYILSCHSLVLEQKYLPVRSGGGQYHPLLVPLLLEEYRFCLARLVSNKIKFNPT